MEYEQKFDKNLKCNFMWKNTTLKVITVIIVNVKEN